jgi:hypothetical protein
VDRGAPERAVSLSHVFLNVSLFSPFHCALDSTRLCHRHMDVPYFTPLSSYFSLVTISPLLFLLHFLQLQSFESLSILNKSDHSVSSSTKLNNSKSSGSNQGDKNNSNCSGSVSGNGNGIGSARNDSNNMKMNGTTEDILNYGSVDSSHSNFSNLTLPSTSS